jgi:hypothetical protein
MTLRQRFVYDRDGRCIAAVSIGEEPAAEQWNAQCPMIFRGSSGHLDHRSLSKLWRRLTFDLIPALPATQSERKGTARSC